MTAWTVSGPRVTVCPRFYDQVLVNPGGVNVGFADGSVKFIKNSINLFTWWCLGTRNGAEIISADQY